MAAEEAALAVAEDILAAEALPADGKMTVHKELSVQPLFPCYFYKQE